MTTKEYQRLFTRALIGLLPALAWPMLAFSAVSPAFADAPTSLATEQVSRTPQELYNALLTTAVDEGGLPPGFSVLAAQAREAATGRLGMYHAVGRLSLPLRGPDTASSIQYTVYPTEADARASFERIGLPTQTGRFSPAGLEYPAQCITGTSPPESQPVFGMTFCFVLVGNVEVTGYSALRRDTQRGDNDHAVALAQSGVAHLLQLQAVASPAGR